RARIIQLRFFESLSFEETATELGLPLNTVKSHFYRGLGELRGGMR
ncbi:MAG: RNA polymerase subunit sigma-24, partial [Planctomycetes bacterium]|nr:RNA polymerase subunit sigma-24 [Planctomycetota bacterium]